MGPAAFNPKRLAAIAALAMAFASALSGQAATWRIDPLHSSAQFSVRHMMISTVRGQFGEVKGVMKYDADLKTAEFFDVKRYPVMTFRSKKVAIAAPGKLRVTGDLTINAITRPVVLEVDGPTAPVRDTQGREKVGVSATAKISRKEFGILYNPIMESGGVAVSDEVTINLEIELIRGQD